MSNNNSWNAYLIYSNFPIDIANLILATSPSGRKDKLTQCFNKGGKYSIASRYKIAYSFFHTPSEVLLGFMWNKRLWSSIWSIQVPLKIKLFFWKAVHEGLSVKAYLHRRIPSMTTSCIRCDGNSKMCCITWCPAITLLKPGTCYLTSFSIDIKTLFTW